MIDLLSSFKYESYLTIYKTPEISHSVWFWTFWVFLNACGQQSFDSVTTNKYVVFAIIKSFTCLAINYVACVIVVLCSYGGFQQRSCKIICLITVCIRKKVKSLQMLYKYHLYFFTSFSGKKNPMSVSLFVETFYSYYFLIKKHICLLNL